MYSYFVDIHVGSPLYRDVDRSDPERETAPAVCRALIFTMRERYGANDRPAVYGNPT